MATATIGSLIAKLGSPSAKLYVAPKINYEYPASDYLYNLYKPLADQYPEISIKSLTVFNHYKVFFAALFSRKTVLHYHWLEFQGARALMGMPWKLFWILMYKLIGGKLIWTIHNEEPHDQKHLKMHHFLHKMMAKISNLLHVHCESATYIMSEKLKCDKTKFRVVPHPFFPSKYIDKSEAIEHLKKRFNLNISSKHTIALLFGQISTYKQICELLEEYEGDSDKIQFLIAGNIKKGSEELEEKLIVLCHKNKNIHLVRKFITDSELPYFLNAADVCLFNYRKILTSGGLYMALSYGRPVIAPKLGCIAEFEGNNNVYLFENRTERNRLINSFQKHE